MNPYRRRSRPIDPVGPFGEWLSDQLNANHMTERELSQRAEISQECVSMHIRGRRRPTFSTVKTYCRIFHCVDDIFDVYEMAIDSS